ncbi:DUF1189 family protein, partial [Patescibacteria group bacterium]
ASVVIPMAPKIKTEAGEFLTQTTDLYPEELVVTAKNGEWLINQEEPYVIPTPDWMRNREYVMEEDVAFKFPVNFAVLDHGGTINDLEDKDTLMVVNEANLIVRGSNKIEVRPLDSIPDGRLDKSVIVELSASIEPFINYIPYILALVVTIGAFFYFFVWRIAYLVIIALVLMFLSLFNKLNLDFRSAYRIGLHACTLPLLIEVVINLLPMELGFLPNNWFFFVNVIFGLFVIMNLGSKDLAQKDQIV